VALSPTTHDEEEGAEELGGGFAGGAV